MNDLIKVRYRGEGPTVSGRELHAALEVKTEYKDWFPRMCEYGFGEGNDFRAFLSESTGGRPAADHEITLEMAKEIAMLQRTDKGKECRQYFIDLEKKWNEPASVMARALQMADRQLKSLQEQNTQLLPKAQYYDALVDRNALTSFRDTARLLEIPEKTFISRLIDSGYIYRDAGNKLKPYASKNKGYFSVKEYVNPSTGATGVQTMVTVKGREHFITPFN